MYSRLIAPVLAAKARRHRTKVIVLVGLPGVGTTSLVEEVLPDWTRIDLSDPLVRARFSRADPHQWVVQGPRVILDGVDGLPDVVATIEGILGTSDEARCVLVTSSRRLAGAVNARLGRRAARLELTPLTITELAGAGKGEEVPRPRLAEWLWSPTVDSLLTAAEGTDPTTTLRHEALLDEYLQWGGMPELWVEEVRGERSAARLSRLARVMFDGGCPECGSGRGVTAASVFERLSLRPGARLNSRDLARWAGVSAPTARAMVDRLVSAGLVGLVPGLGRGRGPRLVTAPVAHCMDPGLARGVTGRWGPPTEVELRSAVVAEVLKLLVGLQLPVVPWHVATYDGRRVDLLLERDEGAVAVVVEDTRRADMSAGRSLVGLDELVGKTITCGLVVSRDPEIALLRPGMVKVPASWLLGTVRGA